MENIETKRFILRKVEKEDNKDIFEILKDDNVIDTLNMNKPESIKDIDLLIENYLEEYENGNKKPYAIIDKETNEFLGVFLLKLDLYKIDSFEFTIYIKKEAWGQGIYSEILPYMIKDAFENIKTKNLRGYIMERNSASERVLIKNNFKLEEIFEVENIYGYIKSYVITEEMYRKMSN